jgi:hypothetical protein
MNVSLVRRLAVTIVLLLLAAPARAQSVDDTADLYRRPRFSVAIGLGASVDHTAGNPHPDRPQPAFFFSAGLGDGLFGLDLRSFGNGATKVQVTRVSLEAVLALRPFALLPPREDYLTRVVHTVSLDVGPCLERVAKDVKSDWRSGAVVGAHVDLPLGYADAAKELRVRLGLRSMYGTTATLTGMPVTDSDVELYGQLAFVF